MTTVAPSPAAARPAAGASLAALVAVLLPDGPERGLEGAAPRSTIVATNLSEIARDLAADGIGLLVPPPGRRRPAVRLADRAGLVPVGAYAYRAGPPAGDAVMIALAPTTLRDVVTRRRRPGVRRSLLARAAGWAPVAGIVRDARPDVALLLRRPPARPLAAWLLDGGTAEPGSIVIRASGPPEDRTSILRLRGGIEGPLIAKIRAGDGGPRRLLTESRALSLLGAGAEAAGAAVPRTRIARSQGGARAIVGTELPGTRLAEMLAWDPASAPRALSSIAAWLDQWSARTASSRVLRAVDLHTLILEPAAALDLPPSDMDGLRRLCRGALGTEVPMIATHGDLTAHNVLMRRDGGIGVVDWECAEPEGLPLTDFAYAAVDVLRAARHDQDRVSAFMSMLDDRLPAPRLANRLGDGLADRLQLSPPTREVCRVSCWLRHAANEAGRRTRPGDGDFARIARRLLAAGPGG